MEDLAMIESTAVRETMLDFYDRIDAHAVAAFDRLVADDPTLVPMTTAMAPTAGYAGTARAAGAAGRSAAGR